MKRKILLVLITVGIMLCLFSLSAIAASDFVDMPSGSYGQTLQKAVDNGLLSGYDNKIMPDEPLTRGQMAAMVSRAFGAYEKADITAFTDVSAHAWYYAAMQQAVQMGAFVGSNTKLLPEKYITREEAFVVIARVLKLSPESSMEKTFTDGSKVSAWANGLVCAMVNQGYIHGDGNNLGLQETITRQDFATVFDNVIKTYVQEAGTVEKVASGNVMVNAAGVTLKNLTVTGDLIVGEGVANGDVILDNVTVTGRMVVRGGGQNSMHIKNNSKIGSLVVSKTDSGAVRIATEAGCSVEFTYIDDGNDDVILEGTFTSVSVTSNVPVVVKNAAISAVTVTGEAASLKIEGTSTVAKVEITEAAKGASLEVAKNSKVTKVETVAEKVSIAGAGTISEAVISGNNTAVNTSGTKMVVSQGVSGASQNGNTVSSGSTTTTQATTASGGGGGGTQASPINVSTFAGLQSANTNAGVSTINITANFEITENITLVKPVVVAQGVTLTNGANLTVNNSFELDAATLINNSTITVGNNITFGVYMSNLRNEGTFALASGTRLELDRGGVFDNKDTLTNNGTIYIGIEGGCLDTTAIGATTTNSGLIIVYSFLNGTVTADGGTIENHFAKPTTEAEFIAALDNTEIDHIYIATSMQLDAPKTFTKKVEVDKIGDTDVILTLNANVVISGENGYFAIDGDDTNYGSIVVNAGKSLSVVSGGSIAISGELEVQGTLLNEEEITVGESGVLYLEGGSFTNALGATLSNEGNIRLFSSASLTNNGTLQQDGGLLVVDVYDDSGCIPCTVTGTLLNNAHSGYIAEINNATHLLTALGRDYSAVHLNVDASIASALTLSSDMELTVTENKTLTVVQNVIFEGEIVVSGTVIINNCDLTNTATGQFTVQAGGTLEIDNNGEFINNGTLTNNGTVNVRQNNGGVVSGGGTFTGNAHNIITT